VDDVVPAAPGGTLAVAPNPFNPSTTLRFDLAASGTVQAEICDLGGRVVRRLARGVMAAGPVVLAWDGRDDAGFPLPSGVYVARVTGAGPARTAKLVLAK
jgi:flagellar hook assembly protein FlgD